MFSLPMWHQLKNCKSKDTLNIVKGWDRSSFRKTICHNLHQLQVSIVPNMESRHLWLARSILTK